MYKYQIYKARKLREANKAYAKDCFWRYLRLNNCLWQDSLSKYIDTYIF